VDSTVWQPHFEGWVERYLIAREVEKARETHVPPDAGASYRAVVELTEQRVFALLRPGGLPAGVRPRLAARGLSSDAIAAARMFAKGDVQAALAAASAAGLERDADALHLRAQLLDELADSGSPRDRLDSIQAYRLALSFDRSKIQASRARVRIAQRYLDLSFEREAMASVQPYLDDRLEQPYDLFAKLTFIEAASRARDFEAALRVIGELPDARLSASQRAWVTRKAADLHFRREEFGESARAYESLRAQNVEAGLPPLDTLSSLRLGFDHLKTKRLEDARRELLDLYRQTDRPRSPDAPVEPAPLPGTPLSPTSLSTTSDAEAPDTTTPDAQAADGTTPGAGSEPEKPTPPAASLEAPETLLPLISLLRIQTEAQAESYEVMHSLASQTLTLYLTSAEAPLLAVAALEGERLKGPSRRIPGGVTQLADIQTRDPAVALLTLRLELLKEEHGQQGLDTIDNLAQLARRLPRGTIQALVHDEMAYRLLTRAESELARAGTVEPALLDIMERELSARQMREDSLLFALEAFRRAGRMNSCARWARAMREREVRPLRRGLGAWREVQCRRFSDEEPISRQELTELADSGAAGPFSLALAALVGEALLRDGELQSSIRIYERALESYPEPQLVGPVLMRLGELHGAASREGLARRRLERGLGLTGDSDRFQDPFRKLGFVSLSELVTRRGNPERLQQLMAPDVDRLSPWWPSAYRFLADRAGIRFDTPTPGAAASTDPFAEGLRTLEEGRKLRKRLLEILAAQDTGSPTEPGTP